VADGRISVIRLNAVVNRFQSQSKDGEQQNYHRNSLFTCSTISIFLPLSSQFCSAEPEQTNTVGLVLLAHALQPSEQCSAFHFLRVPMPGWLMY
jgi:hypothetical protein